MASIGSNATQSIAAAAGAREVQSRAAPAKPERKDRKVRGRDEVELRSAGVERAEGSRAVHGNSEEARDDRRRHGQEGPPDGRTKKPRLDLKG